MGILDGSLADSIFAGFKGQLLSGIIRQRTVPMSGSLDELGDPQDLAPTDTAIEGFTEDYSDTFRARAGIPAGDIKVNIFAKSAPAITPSKDDLVRFTQAGVARWYQLRAKSIDPAGAMWVCRAFPIVEPV